jgi:two-component system, sensor histidine kinase and response regulator
MHKQSSKNTEPTDQVKKMLRYEAMLEASAQVNHTLLRIDDANDALSAALRLIGVATAVDRAYVFEVYRDSGDGRLCCSQINEWSSPSVEAQIDNPELQGLPFEEDFPRWAHELDLGNPIQGLIRDFPELEQEVLVPQGILSILVVPITIRGNLWGFVGFDNCTTEYQWTKQETHTLTSLAANIGLAIERERTMRALADSLKQQQEIAKFKENLITTISHEIRTPLTAVIMNAQLVSSQLKRLTSGEGPDFCARINAASQRILSLLDQALFIGGSAKDKLIPDYRAIDLVQETNMLLAEMQQGALQQREVVLSFELRDYGCITDWKILREVLFNLLDNAAKYSAPPSRIKLELEVTEDDLTIAVHDQGIGIAEDDLAKITAPFFRRETTAVIDGAGLGLTVVNEAVSVLGGRMEIQSKLGRGSSFVVILPCKLDMPGPGRLA